MSGWHRLFVVYAVVVAVMLLVGCQGSGDQHGIGYRDGYAVGYNTACEIRATAVNGTWDDKEYSRGYAEGMPDGVADCNADRKAGTVK